MKKYSGKLVVLFMICVMLAGCGNEEEKTEEPAERTIYEISVPNVSEFCVDQDNQNLYYTVSGQSAICQAGMDGKMEAQFEVTADEAKPEVKAFMGEKPADAADLSKLCIYGDTVYCFRELKNTLMAVDIKTGKSRLCTTLEESSGVLKIAAGAHSVLLLQFGMNGMEIRVFHTDTTVLEKVSMENPLMIAYAGNDTYWIEAYDEEIGYYFQEYAADTGKLSEKYQSNFTYELSEMTCSQETGMLYGRYGNLQYVCLDPREATAAARFTAQMVYESPACLQMAGNRLYVQSRDEEKIYFFEPAAFVRDNKPLKGYVTSEFGITDWAGYHIELEVISWEELALKVLAEDKDYDFVIMSTDMAETTAIRDAMAYAPIPEEYIESYWKECRACVRDAATYNGDIWMLPLKLYASGLVYSEKNLSTYGISMDEMQTIEDVCRAANTLYEAGNEGRYGVTAPWNDLVQEYLWKEMETDYTISFDTDEFRALLNFVQGKYGVYAPFRDSYVQLNAWEFLYDENSSLTYMEQYQQEIRRQAETVYMEEVSGYNWEYEKYIGAEGIRVCAVPGLITTESPVAVKADVIVINPNTVNKEGVFSFLTDLSEAYLADPATYLSADSANYDQDIVIRDVCSLYENGEILFGLPDDLFEIYWRYVWGQETDQEKVIDELNRTVNMYYGE